MTKAPPKPEFSTRKGNDAAMLSGVDGRSSSARRYREITAHIQVDLGGDLTQAQQTILARVATLAIWCEGRESELARGESFNLAEYTTATNTLRRLLADLGLKREPRNVTPDLTDYLAEGRKQ